MHPQSGKSTLASVWTPFWWLANRPSEKSVVATYSSALAAQQNRLLHRLVDANGERYGLENHGSGARWPVTEGGGVWHVGVGSATSVPVTGIAIIDDPHKNRAEAESPATRQRLDDWYLAEFLPRLAPRTPLLMVQSPWHRHDLGHTVLEREGRVEDGGAWTVLGNGFPLLV